MSFCNSLKVIVRCDFIVLIYETPVEF